MNPTCLSRSVLSSLFIAWAIAMVPLSDAQAQGPTSRVSVWNNYGSTIQVYAVDRWGGWRWSESIGKGDTVTFRSPAGQIWNVADKRGRVIKQFRAQSGRMTVAVEKDSGEAELTVRTDRRVRPYDRPVTGVPWDRPELEIRNRTDFPVMAYEVTRWGAWSFRAMIRSDDEFETRSLAGARWLVTTRQGRVLREFEMRDRDTRIDIRD